jgi:hypothetical protein
MKKSKFVSFAIICLWALGTIGGFGYALYGGSWPCAAGCAINGILALPTVKEHFNNLQS